MFRVAIPASVKTLAASAVVLLLTVAPVLISPVFAGRYVVEKGKGVEVCENYQKNLNRAAVVHENARCDRPVDPTFAGQFSKPVWQRVDGKENMGLLVKAYDYIFPIVDEHREMLERKGLIDDENRSRRQNIEDWLVTGQLLPELTQVDFDNDGNPEPLLRWNQCASAQALSGLPIVAFKPGLGEVDSVIMRPLSQSDDPSKVIVGIFPGVNYDLFRYRDKIYFDVWQQAMEEDRDRRFILRVLRDDQGKITEWCRYRFSEGSGTRKN